MAHFVYNSGGSRGGTPVLFLDQTEARRAEKNLWRPPPPLLSQGLDQRAPPPSRYLKVWIGRSATV